MDANNIAEKLVAFYYGTFDRNRTELASLYHDGSMLTFEGSQHLGRNEIIEKLSALPFNKVMHVVNTVDAQPSLPLSPLQPSSTILVSVSGNLKVDDEENLIPFFQTFLLIPQGDSYVVHNDIFRLNIG